MKSKYRWLILCAALSFLACVLVALSVRESSADMGPKPSIELQSSAVAGVVVLLIYRFFVRMNGDFW